MEAISCLFRPHPKRALSAPPPCALNVNTVARVHSELTCAVYIYSLPPPSPLHTMNNIPTLLLRVSPHPPTRHAISSPSLPPLQQKKWHLLLGALLPLSNHHHALNPHKHILPPNPAPKSYKEELPSGKLQPRRRPHLQSRTPISPRKYTRRSNKPLLDPVAPPTTPTPTHPPTAPHRPLSSPAPTFCAFLSWQ